MLTDKPEVTTQWPITQSAIPSGSVADVDGYLVYLSRDHVTNIIWLILIRISIGIAKTGSVTRITDIIIIVTCLLVISLGSRVYKCSLIVMRL